MENNKKYLKVYTNSMMRYLTQKGFKFNNFKKTKIWYFERTPEIERVFEEYISKSKTSASAEDTNK
ncbi:MAG: hypothetical protein JG776_2167 [Caloramator sp.]|jgi:hypothetical protein|uniref:DUF5659 domain-containing protein n=1 Tax=Caloramator sp. TaxID=1871330 RepID=UPI001D52913C|nr:DUF5659 domain-containing protein [Caloramator sp.]MBZ4664449.1 hypothetical protein [Caloramator sp.]